MGTSNRSPQQTESSKDSSAYDKVCIIGSGNWGSAIATIVGRNCQKHFPSRSNVVRMWVYEELVVNQNGQKVKLSEMINDQHENPKYLPGIRLPKNVVAVPDLEDACREATLLIFVLPHQFLPKLLPRIRKVINPDCRGVSLIKGLDFDSTSQRPILISQSISRALGPRFRCGVLMGANVANDVARGQLCESTLACNFENEAMNEKTRQLFNTPTFRVQHSSDIAAAEACGALKNVIALGAGFVDGLGLGSNTKAALLRIGLNEMAQFCHAFFDGVQNHTFLESCGMADLITTCYGGRNRKCAEAFAHEWLQINNNSTRQDSYRNEISTWCEERWKDIERKLLNGQKLQGTLTAQEVYAVLKAHSLLNKFPLMKTIYEIAFQGRNVSDITEGIVVRANSRL